MIATISEINLVFAVCTALIIIAIVLSWAGNIAGSVAISTCILSALSGIGLGIWSKSNEYDDQIIRLFSFLALPWFSTPIVSVAFSGIGITFVLDNFTFLPLVKPLFAVLFESIIIGAILFILWQIEIENSIKENPFQSELIMKILAKD